MAASLDQASLPLVCTIHLAGAALGILRLAKEYGVARLEAACRRGNDIGARSYGSVASILQHGLDRAYAQDKAPEGAPIQHANIRGQGYYH